MDSDGKPLYVVEKIIRHRRIRKGKGYEYFVKWKYYNNNENSWITPENFVMQQMITTYNEKHNISTEDSSDSGDDDNNTVTITATTTNTNPITNPSVLDEFVDRSRIRSKIYNDLLPHEEYAPNLKVEKLLDMHPVDDDQREKIVLVKWETKAEPEYVPAKWCYVHCPQLIIQFFEGRTFFKNKNNTLEKLKLED